MGSTLLPADDLRIPLGERCREQTELSARPSINPKTAIDTFHFTENLRAIQAGFRERIIVLDSDAHVKLGGSNTFAVSNDANGCHVGQADLYFVLNRQSKGCRYPEAEATYIQNSNRRGTSGFAYEHCGLVNPEPRL